MNKEVLDKLMEIKNLYEAGILTKEEMEAEKAKILHPSEVITEKEDEPNVEETEIAPDAQPLPTDSFGRVLFDEPVREQKQEEISQGNDGRSNKTLLWVALAVIVVLVIVLVAANNKSSNNNDYTSNNEEYVDVDSCITDDSHESFDTETDDNDVDYQERAETYISGLSSDTKVVAILTDDERHCVYTLVEVEAGWGRVKNLCCHDLEAGSTNFVIVPYKVEEGDEQISDAKLVGDNLYVINTSYRCGDSVACLNTLTGNWSCIVSECGEARFTGSNKLEYTISTLIHEGESNLDNVYSFETKSLTLK